ncbi:MAG: helix-turn-helix domain-containing protein [Candidatus Njordarchaeota archaeon]
MSDEKFEVLVEWIIRKLKSLDIETAKKEDIIRWVLYSLGVKDIGIEIFLYLRDVKRATTTEIAQKFNMSPTTARKYLEQLHSLGLVDYIGREYHLTRDDISGCIREILIPRVKKVLNDIARIAEHVDLSEKQYIGGKHIKSSEDEIRKAIAEAKKETMESINKLVRDGVPITPDILSGIISKTFDAIAKSLSKMGEKLGKMDLRIDLPRGYVYFYDTKRGGEKHKEAVKKTRGYIGGKSIVETRDKMIYRIYSEHVLSADDFEYAKKNNKRMLIRVYGTLRIEDDVTSEHAEVVDLLVVYGKLIAPRDFVKGLRDKIIVYGEIEYT